MYFKLVKYGALFLVRQSCAVRRKRDAQNVFKFTHNGVLFRKMPTFLSIQIKLLYIHEKLSDLSLIAISYSLAINQESEQKRTKSFK